MIQQNNTHTHTEHERQQDISNNYIRDIAINQAMRHNNIKPYGIVSKKKRLLASGIITFALLPLFSLWLLPFGLYLLGLPFKVLLKSKLLYCKDIYLLW